MTGRVWHGGFEAERIFETLEKIPGREPMHFCYCADILICQASLGDRPDPVIVTVGAILEIEHSALQR